MNKRIKKKQGRRIYKINGKKVSISFIKNEKREGVILVRKGKPSISFGDDIQYAQARFVIERTKKETKYIKGMMIWNQSKYPVSDFVVFYRSPISPIKTTAIKPLEESLTKANEDSDVLVLSRQDDWERWQRSFSSRLYINNRN